MPTEKKKQQKLLEQARPDEKNPRTAMLYFDEFPERIKIYVQ